MVFAANRNVIHNLKIRALRAESVVDALSDFATSRFEFWTTNRWSIIHSAYGDSFYLSAIFEVCTISATFEFRLITIP